MIGEFEIMMDCPHCNVEQFITVMLTGSDANGNGFNRTDTEPCNDCGESFRVTLTMSPEFEIETP